jgi:hypothetical protein
MNWAFFLKMFSIFCSSHCLHVSLLTNSVQQRHWWQANGSSLVKKHPTLYKILRFITAFTRARHLYLFWARSIQPSSWRSTLTSSYRLFLCLPSGIFPSGFPAKSRYAKFLSPCVLHASTHSFFLIWSQKNICWGIQIIKFLFTPPSPGRSKSQKSSSVPSLPPSMWATKFPTHAKQKTKL